MKSSIKIIKRKRDDQPQESKPSESEDSVERGTREIVSTVKSWIAELQQKKRAFPEPFVLTSSFRCRRGTSPKYLEGGSVGLRRSNKINFEVLL